MVGQHLTIVLYNTTSLQVTEQEICGRKLSCPKHPYNYTCFMNVKNFMFATISIWCPKMTHLL